MMAFKCARCGQYYDWYEDVDWGLEHGNALKPWQLTENGKSDPDYFDLDPIALCPDCMKKLEKWLRKEGPHHDSYMDTGK